MKLLKEFTEESILEDEVFEEVFSQEDEIYKARLLLSLQDRANELKIGKKFEAMVKAYKRVEREMKRIERENKATERRMPPTLIENWTNFDSDGKYDNMFCGAWIASEDGIYSSESSQASKMACYHPILPIERLKNLETGEEQLKIAYKRSGIWREIIVPKTIVASASKIVALSGQGIAVTSENAKLLVQFLADVENRNGNHINVQYSTSKLGWIKGFFVPYDTDIVFDGNSRFKQIYEAIDARGNRNKWFDYVSQLRRIGRKEIKFMLAASFASVLVGMLGVLPFFVDLWGETEGGKTVSLMLACSVWANPDESQYIGDFKTTDVALEARADMLNNLPMILDDTSKVSARIRDNFEGIVYDLCSGKGKSRSNKDLGMNRENRWKNCILTNGERPLNSYVGQGGAINRIIEVAAEDGIFTDPRQAVDVFKKNYGYAGQEFIQILKDMDHKEILELQQDFLRLLSDDEKMQKQSISMSVILTADKIVTDYLFKDGCYISIDDAKSVILSRNEVSDNQRCYEYLIDKISMNGARFDVETKIEKWGIIENEYAIIYNAAFDALCKDGGYSKKSFLSWAIKHDLVVTQGGNPTKVKKINGSPCRCVWLKLDDSDGFIEVEDGQIELPFH